MGFAFLPIAIGTFVAATLIGIIPGSIAFALMGGVILGSFGASAVLIYGAVRSPLAQPRNLLGGHILSAVVGVTACQWLGGTPWLAAAVAGGDTCRDRVLEAVVEPAF